MRFWANHGLLIGFLLSLALLGGVAGLNWRHAARTQATAEWVRHTQSVRYELDRLLMQMQDVETSMRGFVITGDDAFLRPLEAVTGKIGRQLHVVRDLTRDNFRQQANCDRLSPLLARRVALAQANVDLRRSAGFTAAQQAVARGEGLGVMNQIRELLERMDQEEATLLVTRAAAARAEAETAQRFTLLGTGLSLGLLVAVFFLMLRENRLRRCANLALRESEENLAVTLQSIGDGVLATDAAGRVTRLNAVAETLTGWKQADAAGRPVAEVFHIINEQTREPAVIPVSMTLDSGTIQGLANHTELIARDGSARPIADSCAPIRGRDGRVVGAVLVFRDVTEQRRQEQAVRASQRELEAAVRANRLIMEYSLDVICTIDEQGRFAFVSAASHRLWGYAPDELVGRSFLDLIHPDDHAKSNQAAADVMAGAALRNFENRYVRPDGTMVPIVWSASWSATDKLLFCVAHDVTERKRAEAAIHQLNAELHQRAAQLEGSNKELEAFSYSVSHDLRAPLRHIDGFTAKLTRHLGSERLDDTSRRLLGTIAESARNMGRLIDDLIAFARIGRAGLQRTRVSLDQLVAECRRGLEGEINGRTIDWQVAPLTAVEGDPGLLRQVFANLLGNAVKYTGRRPTARIEVGLQPGEPGEVVVYVRDNGAGFDMQYAGKLFGVFQRLHAHTEFEGTGIGLANVRRIIERHGGRIWAEGAVGQGATFSFSLPAPRR